MDKTTTQVNGSMDKTATQLNSTGGPTICDSHLTAFDRLERICSQLRLISYATEASEPNMEVIQDGVFIALDELEALERLIKAR